MTRAQVPLPRPLRRESTLREQASRGDERAFAELYKRHQDALYRYSLTIVRDPDDAADALQSAVAKAIAALRREQRNIDVVPWLFRIVHNESISLIRARKSTVDLEQVVSVGEEQLARTVEDRSRLAQLTEDLADLGERQRAALVMRELSGLSHDEIGAALECSPGAAKQAIYEARAGLAELKEGRAMRCDEVQKALSDADGRVVRSRRIRGHLRDCVQCSAFRDSMRSRPHDLAAIAPALPAAASAALLTKIFAAHGAAGGGAAAAGGAAGGTVAIKSLAVVAATATVAGGGYAVERSVRSDNSTPPPKSAPPNPGAAGAAGSSATPSATQPKSTKTTPASPAKDPASTPGAKSPGPPAHSNAGGKAKGKAAAPGQLKVKPKKPKKPKRAKPNASGTNGNTTAPGQLKPETRPEQSQADKPKTTGSP